MVSLGPAVTKLCTRSGPASAESYAKANDEAVEILSLVAGHPDGLALRDLAQLSGTCRELRNLLDRSEAWAWLCNVKVANLRSLGNFFSTFLLAKQVCAARAHEHLTRKILLGLGSAPEKALLTGLTEVFVCETPADESIFWIKRFAGCLRTSAVPTASQVEELFTAFAVITG